MVFPRIEQPETGIMGTASSLDDDRGSLAIRIPAYRATLDCESFTSESIPWSLDTISNAMSSGGNVTFGCWSSSLANLTTATMHESITISNWSSTDRYVGAVYNIFQNKDDAGMYLGELSTVQWMNNGRATAAMYFQPDCPKLWLQLGHLTVNTTAAPKNYTLYNNETDFSYDQVFTGHLMACMQRLERVQTNVTFILPGLTIDPARPPIPDEETATLVNSLDWTNDTFNYTLQKYDSQPTNTTSAVFSLQYLVRTEWANPPNSNITTRDKFF